MDSLPSELIDYQSLVLEISEIFKKGTSFSIKDLTKLYAKLYHASEQLKCYYSDSNKKLINLSIYSYLSPESIGNPVIAESIVPVKRFQDAVIYMYDYTDSWYRQKVYYILSCFRNIINALIEDLRDDGNLDNII